MSTVELELVLPAYNEEKSLKELINRTILAAKEAKFDSKRFQLIVVQNGSTDQSEKVLADLKTTELGEWFKIVSVHKNQGYGFGLLSGLKATSAPVVSWSHADMQCDPRDVFIAYSNLKKAGNSNILVKGFRYGRNFKDIFVSRMFEFLSRCILGMYIKEMNAQPKVFSREILNYLINPPKTFAFDLYVLYQAQKNGYSIKTIPVLFPPRLHGVSKWAANFVGRYKTIFGIINYMFYLRKTEGKA